MYRFCKPHSTQHLICGLLQNGWTCALKMPQQCNIIYLMHGRPRAASWGYKPLLCMRLWSVAGTSLTTRNPMSTKGGRNELWYHILKCKGLLAAGQKLNCYFRGATFHIPSTKSATLNRLLHCSQWRFSGALDFWGLFFAFWGWNRPDPPCILSLIGRCQINRSPPPQKKKMVPLWYSSTAFWCKLTKRASW